MPLKQTPLYQKHLALGAKIVPFGGWEMPVSYPQGIIAEHNAVRNSLGLFDIGHMGLIKIEGDSSLPFIQKVATNDAAKLEINSCQYSVLCNELGGVVDDILVYRLPMLYMIIANASNTDKVLAWLKQGSSGQTIGLYENYCALSLQGPEAVKAVEKTFRLSLSSLARNHTLWWRDIILSRTGYTGEDGIEMLVAKKEVASIWQMFIDQGVQPCGLGARDTLRLEAGLPLYGHEYNNETTPLEAGYGWAVKFDKGDFIGLPALLQEKESGLKKKLVGISLEGRSIPREGNLVFGVGGPSAELGMAGMASLSSHSEKIGIVTSGTFSPTLKKPIALAYLTSIVKDVFVEIRGEKQPGHVVDKAFYKRVK